MLRQRNNAWVLTRSDMSLHHAMKKVFSLLEQTEVSLSCARRADKVIE
jgi:hypothetical protein